MEINEIVSFKMNIGSYLAQSKKNITDRSGNTVYFVGKEAQVKIDEFKTGSGFQIYRDVGHHVKGNSQKAYKSLDLLLCDFALIRPENK